MFVWNPVYRWKKQMFKDDTLNMVDLIIREADKTGLSINKQAELYKKLMSGEPHLFVHRLNMPIKSSIVLVNNTVDIFDFQEEWLKAIFERINRRSQKQKIFVFTTKQGKDIRKLPENACLFFFVELFSTPIGLDLIPFDNFWLGANNKAFLIEAKKKLEEVKDELFNSTCGSIKTGISRSKTA